MAIGKFLAPLNGRIQTQQPYVDDIFDPLFNKQVREYYNGLYGPIGGIGAGYAAMLDNALTGREGILGPGMGILSTFGRSMDKADDFILGGLTEGVNLLGKGLGGTNQAPVNPIENIFVNDYDYQGTKLMAAMGNSMARLAGTQTPLTEQDFQSMGDKIAGTTLDLATDPGIMGGQLARLNKGTPIGQAGQILSNYDDIMANVAGNMAFPGGKALVGKGLSRIRDFLSGASSVAPIDIQTAGNTSWMSQEEANQALANLFDNGFTSDKGISQAIKTDMVLREMAEDEALKSGITPLDPEYSILEEIREKTPVYAKDIGRIPDSDDMASASDVFVYKQGQKYQDYLKKVTEQKKTLSDSIEQAHQDYINKIKDDVTNFVNKESKYIDSTPVESEEYVSEDMTSQYYDTDIDVDISISQIRKDIKETQNKLDYIEKELSNEKLLSKDKKEELLAQQQSLQNELSNLQEMKDLKSGAFTNEKPHGKSWIISHKQINRIAADKKLQYLQSYIQELKAFDEHIFDYTYLKKEFPGMYISTSPLKRLLKENVGEVYYKGRINSKSSKKYDELMEELHDKFIPEIQANADKLSTNKTGQRLVQFADDLDNTLFKMNVDTTGQVRNIKESGIDLFKTDIDEKGNVFYPLQTENGDLVTQKFTNKTPISDVYNPLMQGLTHITKDDQINTLDEFIRLKKEYPTLTLFLKENSGAYYDSDFNLIIPNTQDEIDFAEEIYKSRYPDMSYKKLQKLMRKNDYTYKVNLPTRITNMNQLYDYLPKSLLNPLPFPKTVTDLYKDISIAVKDPTSISTNLSGAQETFKVYLSKTSPETFAKVVTSNISGQGTDAISILDDTFKQFKDDWAIESLNDPSNLEWYIKKYGTRREMTLFQQWMAAVDSKIKNRLKIHHGTLATDLVKRSKVAIDDIVKNNKYTEGQLREYFTRKDIASGVNISGDNFLESLWASKGFKEIPLDTKYVSKAQGDALAASLKNNVDKINTNGNILKFIDVEKDGTRRLAVMFDVDNLNIKKDINRIYSLFGKKNLGLEDVNFKYNINTVPKFDTTELDAVFDEIRQSSEAFATKLGASKFDPNYFAHTMADTPEAKEIFGKIYSDLGINKDKLDKICEALQNQDIASGKLQFGAIPYERSHLGYFSQYGKGFTTDLQQIHSQTFTGGMFENTNAQTFFDLFLTDNFKIKNNFDNVATLKEALFLKDKNGKLAGNLNNLSLVAPRYNDAGKLIGFTRYDKFSDASLLKAFNDENAILVPDSVIGSLDRICKKDARMSNKVYAFINKYLTVPFKFGTLANPGFLAGNIQDAYFKQAVELSKKYGTDLGEELTNVAMSMRHVTVLNNNFADIFEKYKTWLKDTDLTKISSNTKNYNDIFRKAQVGVDSLTIDQVVSNPEAYRAFKNYIDEQIPVNERKLATLYIYLNNNQTTSMFKNNNKDLEDLADLVTDNPYATPNNIVERIMYGDPSKTKIIKDNAGKFKQVQDTSFRSYGLFLNNPLSNRILKSSNNIENWMRSATILNDLQHQGYTMDQICDILELDKVTEQATRAKFKMSMNEAINTMYAANFDYDNVGNVMNKVSYILPFPTFYLKNLAFWADIFTNKPQLIDNVISTHEGLWSGKDTSDKFTAEAKGRGALPIGQQGNKHLTGIVKQTPYNSMFGAFNAVNNLKEDFAYRTNPALRPIARHLQDPDDVKYRPYNTQQFQKNIKQSDPEFSELAYMFHQLNPYERFINTGLRTPGKIANNSYQVSDFLPSMFQPDFSKKSR